MKIHHAASAGGHVGQRVNTWMWRELFPDVFPALAEGSDDDVHFIGAGSLLDDRLPRTGLNVVLGAGAGHGPVADMHSAPARWQVYGVRGPLSARLLGLPRATVLTDPAVLLAGHPRWQRGALNLQRTSTQPGISGMTGMPGTPGTPGTSGRSGTSGTPGAPDTPATPVGRALFVPQRMSARLGQWQAVCSLLGIDVADPHDDARTRIDRLAGARLVITESLQAAVVADALRVPWIPIVLSREVASFSWADWAATLGMEYTPLLLRPSSPLEAWRNRWLEHSAFARIGAFHDQARRDGGPRELAWTQEQLLGERRAAMVRAAQPWRRRGSVAAGRAFHAAAGLVPATHQRVVPGLYRRLREQAAAQLQQVLTSPPRLSADSLHRRALGRCFEAVDRLGADFRAGKFARPSGASP